MSISAWRPRSRGSRQTSCTSSGSPCPRSTSGCRSGARRSSPPTTSSPAGPPTSARSGRSSSRASTASSCTPSAAARRSSSSGRSPVVIPHPVYPSDAMRADDGQTILALGVIRPYKGLADAVEVVSRLPDARLLVAGDPAMPLDGLRDAPRTEWRLGYLTPGGARPGALGGDRRDLPVQGRARPVRRAAPGSRRRASRRSPTTSEASPSRS